MAGMVIPGWSTPATQGGSYQQHPGGGYSYTTEAQRLQQQQEAARAAAESRARALAALNSQVAQSSNSVYKQDPSGATSFSSAPSGYYGNTSGGAAGGNSGGSSSSSSSGGGNLDWQQQLELQARLTREAEERRMQMIKELQASMGAGRVTGSAGDENDAAARSAAFARAKDQVGLSQRAALDSLRDVYAGGGNMGGMTSAAKGMLGGGLDQLGEVSRDIALSEAQRSGQVADRNYSGDIAQRAQDMAYMQQLLGLFNARAY